MALAQYSKLFWYPSGELATNVPARVFQHETNTLATLYADAGGTTPLANPASTSAAGRLEFWVEEGEYWVHIDSESFEIAVGASTEGATLADVTAAVAAHNADTTDVHGVPNTADLETQTGAQSKATAAQTAATTAAATDATSKVTAHAGASDPHGDRAWAASQFATVTVVNTLTGTVTSLQGTVAAIDGFLNDCLNRVAAIEQGTAFLNGAHFTGDVEVIGADLTVRGASVVLTAEDQVILGEKTFNGAIPVGPGFDPEFDNQLTRKAYVDAAIAAAGGGSSVRTATVRVTDDDLSGLPAAASWTVVQTSGGTQLKASIAAAVGDRIRVYGAFMHIGSHFLDWALLDSGGTIAVYATTGTSSPPAEGNPTMYTSNSFLPVPSPDMFTVASGHLNAGMATVALVHQGLGTGNGNLVYAHPTYPWRLRLENIGPEPA
jgi:hypothetical protein